MVMNIALVGSGIQAREAYVPAILARPILNLVAIYSRTYAAASSLHAHLPVHLQSHVKLFSDDTSQASGGTFADILRDPDIHGVIIALPILSQPSFVAEAIKAGKHVLSEKPIAPDLVAACALVKEYDNAKRHHLDLTWHVAENWRLLPAVNHAAEEIRRLGKVLGFRTRQSLMMSSESPFLASSWRSSPALKGGLLLDGAVHGIAVLRLLLGDGNDVTRVSAFSHLLQSHLPAPDTLDAIVKTSTGITGVVQISYGTTFEGPVFEVACERGVVRVDGFDTVVVMAEGREADNWTGGGLSESTIAVIDSWVGEMQGENPEKRLSVRQALKDLQIIREMLRSAEGEGIPIDLEMHRGEGQ